MKLFSVKKAGIIVALLATLSLVGGCAPLHLPGLHLPGVGMGGMGGSGGDAGHGSMSGGAGTSAPYYEHGSRTQRDDVTP